MHFLFLADAVASGVPAARDEGNQIEKIAHTFGIETGPLIVQIVSFVALVIVVWYFGFRPLMKTLDERQRKIEDGLKFSDEMKAKLAQSEADYKAKMQAAATDASEVIENARKTAHETIEKAGRDAIARAEQIEQRAMENIAREREKMFEELKDELATLVVETTAKVLSREISPAEKEKLAATAAGEIAGTK